MPPHWLLEVQNGQQMSCILPIVVHQSSGGAIWDSRDFHHFFEHVPDVFLEFIFTLFDDDLKINIGSNFELN
jgi:hypothetical protein